MIAGMLFVVGVIAGRPAAGLHHSIFWFDLGHRVIARIAESRLRPGARAAVAELLAGQSMADASVWADQIRGARRETSLLHYVNIPLAATAYDSASQCPQGCIISAISSDRRILADSTASTIQRTEALKFLIHFVGDLHQPLHVADRNDRGGNEVAVSFFGTSANLHAVWDGKLIERGYTEDSYLAHLVSQMSGLDLSSFESGSVVDWAMEGHRLAVEYAYRLPANNQLGEIYERNDLPIVDRAMIKAGVRLAAVLNAALAGYHAGPRSPSLGTGTWTDREAAAHAGQEGTVVGTIVTVHRTESGNLHLNFGADYPHQTFSIYIERPQDPALSHLDDLAGKRVAVTGVIRIYQGTAEIRVTSRNQIRPAPRAALVPPA